MSEITKTCDPHRERETLQVYLQAPGALNFVGGRGYLSISPSAGSNVDRRPGSVLLATKIA
jgi:hypothetical protein